MVSPQYELSYVYQKHSSVKKFSHNGCIDMDCPQYEFPYAFLTCIITRTTTTTTTTTTTIATASNAYD